MQNIAILCSGGDVSSMNAAIKHFVEYSFENSLTPYFVYDGYEGLIDNNIKKASYSDVSGIINRGGTMLRSSRSSRFMKYSYRIIAVDNLKKLGIDMLIILGGDGSFRGMHKLSKEFDIKVCGVPSTIDNDIALSDYSLGVDTSLNVIKNAIDSIRDTASSFKRAFVIETMGRDCGFLALVSSLTSGAEMLLIPEVEYDLDKYKHRFKQQVSNGRNYFIAVVSEGIKDDAQSISKWFEEEIGIESRATILGHIQRGSNPSVYDRLMAYKFINHAVDALLDNKKSSVVCHSDSNFKLENIDDVVGTKKELDRSLLKLAKSML